VTFSIQLFEKQAWSETKGLAWMYVHASVTGLVVMKRTFTPDEIIVLDCKLHHDSVEIVAYIVVQRNTEQLYQELDVFRPRSV
jgi:hypothetical protein